MKNRKTRIIMGIMVGLVLFSSSVALLLYLKQTKHKEAVQNNIEVFVAAKKINKGDIINAKSLKKTKLPKSYIQFTPLTDAEIIGRYANVDIYKDEPIRMEKISASKPVTKIKQAIKKSKTKEVQATPNEVQQVTEDTLSVSLSVFKNKNTLLKEGDYVDIVSVIPSNTKANNFNTKYIALHVKVNNFVSNGKTCSTPISYNAKKQIVRADTIVLLMSPKDIKNFLAIYYKTQALNANRVYNTNNYGGQLWMIKTPKEIDQKIQKQKERLLVDKKVSKKQRRKHIQRAKITYEN
jgi:hypothetical protein